MSKEGQHALPACSKERGNQPFLTIPFASMAAAILQLSKWEYCVRLPDKSGLDERE
jgi:hypothetical protein